MEYPLAYELDRPKARKKHECCECHGTICVGEIYYSHSGIFDDGPFRYKICCDCTQLSNELDQMATYPEDKVCLTGLSDSVFESGDLHMIERFVLIKTVRAAHVPKWMLDRIQELKYNK